MQINNITNGAYSDPLAVGQRGATVESPGPKLLKNLAAIGETSSGTTSALRDILSEYDVTNITPREFSEMLQKMHKSGIITDEELTDLNQIRIDLEGDGVDADESIDLVEHYADKLRASRQSVTDSDMSAEQPSLKGLQRRFDWLDKLAAIQSAPDEIGLDTLA